MIQKGQWTLASPSSRGMCGQTGPPAKACFQSLSSYLISATFLSICPVACNPGEPPRHTALRTSSYLSTWPGPFLPPLPSSPTQNSSAFLCPPPTSSPSPERSVLGFFLVSAAFSALTLALVIPATPGMVSLEHSHSLTMPVHQL